MTRPSGYLARPQAWMSDLPSTTPDPLFDPSVAHPARVYGYWLGGKDHYQADREAAEEVIRCCPRVVAGARANRAFLARVVRYLAVECGIRQFIDIGPGLPAPGNTHDVAQAIAPESRIVYVDNDPLVLAHARALLTSTSEGATAYVHADLRDTGEIMAEAAKTLDFTKPIALILSGILGHVTDTDEARSIVRRLMDALPSGSYLSLNDGTSVIAPEEFQEAQEDYNQSGALPYVLRTPDEIASFFNGLELVEPGVVSCPRWRPEPTQFGPPADVDAFGGVGRKP